MESKSVLYISYDGLTDPLGQSQILPYLAGLSKYGYRFTILSFEKKQRLEKEYKLIKDFTEANKIRWVPLSFTTKPPLLSKLYDAIRMRNKAIQLYKKEPFDMVHCRSYPAADVGLYLKKRFGLKFLFDMRGFWADEKKDGSWDLSNPIYKGVYRYYKSKEAAFLKHADQVIALTYSGKEEMQKWAAYNNTVPLDVIPCCADMDHFSLTDQAQKAAARLELELPSKGLVLSYLGSVGTWYMLEEMLLFFKQTKKSYPDAKFLFITHSDPGQIRSVISSLELKQDDVIIREASRKEVPFFLKASDVNLSFIKPVYSKISSSPTKIGEVLSIGIPIIANSGVGDVKKIIDESGVGFVLNDFTEKEFEKAINAIPNLLTKPPASIRAAIEDIYSLKNGIEKYRSGYQKLLQ